MSQLLNTANIAQIIASLQSSEGINQKPALAAVIGSPTVAADEISVQVAALAALKSALVANLVARGKTANTTESLNDLIAKTVIDSDCIPANILNGIVIDGVTGSYVPYTVNETFEYGLNPITGGLY